MNRRLYANEARVRAEFKELVQIDSPSFREREMADRLTRKLTEIGFTVREDQAGTALGGNAGNLYAFLRGGLPGGPILISGHMDTVSPGIGKKAVFHPDGRITSAGDTVLGGDDLTGVIEILEGVRITREAGLPHRDIEVLFTVAEEPYTKGSSAFDYSAIQAKEAYVLDISGPVGTAVLQAPTILSFEAAVIGRAAHAGFEPEKGIHAIALMSRAISSLSLGRQDEETTLNIGLIKGGSVVNAVPARCTCRGEIRSCRHERALELLEQVKAVFEDAVRDTGAALDFASQTDTTAFSLPRTAAPAVRFQRACAELGIQPAFAGSFGGSDANSFMLHGIETAVLSCGMYQVHTASEYAMLPDMLTGAALISALIRQEA